MSNVSSDVTPSPFRFNLGSPPNWAVYLGMFFWVMELLIHSGSMAIATLNVVVLGRTRLLHPNLKCVLIFQSLDSWACELGRIVILGYKLYFKDVFYSGVPVWIQMQQGITMGTMGVLGHVLLIERAIATIWLKSYESWKRPYISIVGNTISFLFGISTVLNMGSYAPTIASFFYMIIMTTLCFIEILVVVYIGTVNRKRYFSTIGSDLSEKFQIAENIRTSRQLAPTFIYHFLLYVIEFPVGVVMFYGLISAMYLVSMMLMVQAFLISVMQIGINLTVITHHPTLRRRTCQLLRSMAFWSRSRVTAVVCNDLPDAAVEDDGGKNQSLQRSQKFPLTIDGKRMITLSNKEAHDWHFEALQKAWGSSNRDKVQIQ